MIAPPISSTSGAATTLQAVLSANVSGALQDVIQAVTKLAAANTAFTQHEAQLAQLCDLTNRVHDRVHSFHSHDEELVKIVDSLVGVSTALTTFVDGLATSVSSSSPVPVASPPVTGASAVANSSIVPQCGETADKSDLMHDPRLSVPYEKTVDKTVPVSSSLLDSRPQEGPGPARVLPTSRRWSGMMPPPPQAPPLPQHELPHWTHQMRPWAGSSRDPMSDTASEYSTMSSVRNMSGSGSVSTPSVSSSKRGTPPSEVPFPEEVQIANRLALEKTGVVLPMRLSKEKYFVPAGVLGFLTGTYSSLRSANNTISRHVRDYGHNKDGIPHEGISKFSERWYITVEAFKEHIAPHIRGYKDIWAK